MRHFSNYFGLFLVSVLLFTSCAMEDRTPLSVKGENDISFRESKVLNVLLSPEGPKGFSAEIQLKIDEPYVHILGTAKDVEPGSIYLVVFSDAPECGAPSENPPIIIGKIEGNNMATGIIEESLKLSMEEIRSITINESNTQNGEPGEVKSCGVIQF